VSAALVRIYPRLGRFLVDATVNGAIAVAYRYGFSSTVGAGPYDRRILGVPASPAPIGATVADGGGALAPALTALGATGTVVVGDSLTYTAVADIGAAAPAQQVRIEAVNRERPVIRPAAGTTWAFTCAPGSELELTGLLVSGGCEIVLRGDADAVTIRSATLDPGEAGASPPPVYAQAADGRALAPSRLWIEGRIRRLRLEQCIAASIRTRGPDGEIEILEVIDSIVQSVRTDAFGAFAASAIKDPTRLAARLRDRNDPVSDFLRGNLPAATQAALGAYVETAPPSAALLGDLRTGLNAVLSGPSIYDPTRFAAVALPPSTVELAASTPTGAALKRLNRLLLEAAYPVELGDLALALVAGLVSLTRTTVLGPGYVHRLEASGCVLDDRVLVEDTGGLRAVQRVVDREHPAAPVRMRGDRPCGAALHHQRLRTAWLLPATRHGRPADRLGRRAPEHPGGGTTRIRDGRLRLGPRRDQAPEHRDQVRRVHAARPEPGRRRRHLGGPMSSDRARDTHDETRQYRAVVAQQGRVTVEADLNEAWTIDDEEERETLLDVVGPSGTPDDGYAVGPAANTQGAFDFEVGAGTMYVGGLRSVLFDPVAYAAQSEWLDDVGDPDWVDPSGPADQGLANELVYLEPAEQEVSATEDGDLREVALGGPDIAQRRRLVQRVKRLGTDAQTCADARADAEARWSVRGLDFDPATMQLLSRGRLQVSFPPRAVPADPCDPEADGGYLGADNQLIRVQISAWDDAKLGPDRLGIRQRLLEGRQ
jgi:hypothetical protein